ncbi:hypothetical protein AK812_SmicGene16814 [Symbiodinium microadriaticum]|uniref:Uncharacterized protein n=1 Tax=Symbiodinium microadriaticum TaxID=2951 RepID=A0A1Q9DZC6_SYMMI|nr:hypothetical protein AK812_SmicGene16814 [Symbiodinium microadriaticum]
MPAQKGGCVVTGGLSGFGLMMAREMAVTGAFAGLTRFQALSGEFGYRFRVKTGDPLTPGSQSSVPDACNQFEAFGSDEAWQSARRKSAGAATVVGVTATFQSLINGLVQQHLVELAAAQGASGEDSIGVAIPRQWSQAFRSGSRKITDPKALSPQAEAKDIFGDRAHTSDMERLTSADSAVSSGSERRRASNGGYMRSPTIGDVLCGWKEV